MHFGLRAFINDNIVLNFENYVFNRNGKTGSRPMGENVKKKNHGRGFFLGGKMFSIQISKVKALKIYHLREKKME